MNLENDNEVNDSCTLFWRPQDLNGYLGNWHADGFALGPLRFACVEQWIMWCKAVLFGDQAVAEAVLAQPDPKRQKALGRKVGNFVEKVWVSNRQALARVGCFLKFASHPELAGLISGTGSKLLVEASPLDRIWGVGVGPNNSDARSKARWRGQNVLGYALMWVRDQLAVPVPADVTEDPVARLMALPAEHCQAEQQFLSRILQLINQEMAPTQFTAAAAAAAATQ